MLGKFLPACLSLLLIILPGGAPARAQGAARLSLFALDVSAFPTMTAVLDVFDDSGNFVTGLSAGQVSLLENEQVITPASLEERQPGVQLAVALDPAPFFAYRDADAVTRLDLVRNVLVSWASAHQDSFGDDLSLVPTGGTSASHLEAQEFLQALTAFQPNPLSLTPSLDTLSRAIDIVTEPGQQAGMKGVVLYIASPPDVASVPALQNLTQRAASLGVRVHVWIVASSDYFSTSGATALRDLSILTGGTYALFSGVETLPDPEVYLTPLRHTYALSYASSIRTSGTHSLSAQVTLDGGSLTSNALTFEMKVEPPNPMLVSPPGQILRQGVDSRDNNAALFQPSSQEIEAIIEFPDGMAHQLTRTALYVDGVVADENTSAPFDIFTWDLSGYTRSGDHILQVQATDSLGLEKTSLGLTVTVTVVQPEVGLMAFLARNSLAVTLGAVGAAGAALLITLLVVRRHARTSPQARPRPKGRRDPLTAEVEPEVEAGTRRRLRGRAAAAMQQSTAYLLRLKEDGQPITAPPIPILPPEMTFGSDPIQAKRVLDDPSVSPLHACLREEKGQFMLSDENSIAGTWVNHEPLTAPRLLRHGDVLQIGRIAYRFMLRRPAEMPAPRVTPLKK